MYSGRVPTENWIETIRHIIAHSPRVRLAK